MTTPNTLRRLNWLWKHRHTHDGDDTQDQIQVIREIIERDADTIGAAGSGAYVHLERAATQSIGTSTEVIEWDQLNAAHTPFEFSVSPPVTEVEIRKAGYYDIEAAFALDSGYDGGGVVSVLRNGARVWPPSVDTDIWTTDNGRRFAGVAKGIDCSTGDKISVEVTHNSGSAVNLDWAQLSIELVDRRHGSGGGVKEAGVTDVKYSHEDELVSTHTIEMTSAQRSGDLLLMLLVATDEWTTYPTGWSTLVDNFDFHSASNRYISVLYKESDGSESNVTEETAGNSYSSHIVWVVSSDVDYSTTTPDVGTPVSASSRTINPPAVTPSHGAGNYLVFPLVGHTKGRQTVEDSPDGYSILKYDGIPNEGAAVACGVWQATVAITTSENPTSITVSHSIGIQMGATTLAVKI